MVRILTDAPAEEAAAWIALLALRTSIADTSFRSSEDLLLGGTTKSAKQAVEELVRVEKPLHCTATAQEGLLSLVCRTPSAEEARFHQALANSRAGDSMRWSHLRARVGEAFPRARILCLGRGEPLLVSMTAVERWEQDYTPIEIGWGADAPDAVWTTQRETEPLARELRADYVIHFAPADATKAISFVIPRHPLWLVPFRLAKALLVAVLRRLPLARRPA